MGEADKGMQFDREKFEKRMGMLRRSYVEHLPGRRAELAMLASAIAKNPATGHAREKISEIREIAHNLAGSGGSFGAPEVGAMAAAVEHACDAFLETADPPADGAWREVEKLLASLGAAIDGVIRKADGG